jgi:hypothetical protein
MKNLKTRDNFLEDSSINEMAKDWPVGSIVKFNVKFSEPPSNERCSSRSYTGDNWSAWVPAQDSNAQGGSFYMKITESGKLWLVGKVIYTNGIAETPNTYVRIKTKYAARPADDYKIFEKNEEDIKFKLGKSYFLEGNENGIMSGDGKSKTDVKENEYTVRSMSFKLTDLFDEPVFFLIPKGSNDVTRGFYMKSSSLDTLQKEFTPEQREVISEWFAKELKTEVELNGDNYNVTRYKVVSDRDETKGFKIGFEAGPFLSMADAEAFIENLKKLKTTMFDTSSLRAFLPSYGGKQSYTLDEMILLAKSNGIEVSMKKLLELKRGTVAGKKFGLS